MKKNSSLFKAAFLLLAVIGINLGAKATTYTAIQSGNFYTASTWGVVAPSGNITSGDNVIIPAGIVVTLDDDVMFNSLLGTFAINGTLSGIHNLSIQNGTFTGTGTLIVHNLTFGASGSSAFTGTTTADDLYNSETLLTFSGKVHINDTLGLYAGTVSVAAADTLTFGSNAVIHIDGGTYTAGGGAINLLGNINLLYTGTGTVTAGAETGFANINSMMVNLSSNSNQLQLSGDLTVIGQLRVQSGSLNINGHNLTLNGTVNTTANGSLSGSNTSNLTLGGASNMGILIFTSGSNMLNNLTVNGSAASSVVLGSDLTVSGVFTLTSGKIDLTGSNNLTLTGLDSIHGGSSSSYVSTSGTGSLVTNVSAVVATNSRMMQIGTAFSYAPVRVTNNSLVAGNFSANAHSGIFANGSTGTNLATTLSSVNTSWNVESDIVTGANMALEVYWNQTMEVNGFNRSNVRLSHYINGAWDDSMSTQASVHAGGMASVKRTGITSFSPFAVFSGAATGINDVSANNTTFTSYPNPAINTITISVTDPKQTDEMKVYDMLGNKVASYPVKSDKNMIDISSLTAGVYFVSVNNSATQKFVKQ